MTDAADRAKIAAMRVATCRCGQLRATCTGEPVRVSACHCHNCQRRSGSAFAAQARFRAEEVAVSGDERVWEASGDGGGVAAFHFCPECGSTLYYRAAAFPDLIAVAVGAFADRTFPPPHYSAFEDRKHPWVEIAGPGIEHYD